MNRHLPHTTVLARIWMRCTHPALASEIRRGRSILTRLAAAGDGKEDLMRMATDTGATISLLLDDMADEYADSGPGRRRLIAGAVRIALPVRHRLATAGTGRSADTGPHPRRRIADRT